jgi:hypothetical protein
VTSESKVIAAVVRWLYRNGYGYLVYKEKAHHGVDIRVRNLRYSRYFFIEAKGDPIKAKYPDSSRTVDFWTAIGQIVSRMRTLSADYYGVAFPVSYYKKIKNLPWVFCKKNRLHVFLVDGNKVKCLNWRQLKSLPNKKTSRAA